MSFVLSCLNLRFFSSNVFRLFPFPRKHSWASGSEAVPWLTVSSACGFAVEDAAGIASCTSTYPGKSELTLQTSRLILASCMVSEALIFYNVLCISLRSNHLTDKSLRNNRKKNMFAPEKFVAQSFKLLEFGSLVTIEPRIKHFFFPLYWLVHRYPCRGSL